MPRQVRQFAAVHGEGFILAELHNAPAAYGECSKMARCVQDRIPALATNSDKAGRSHRRRSGGERCSRHPLGRHHPDPASRSFLAVPMLKERELVGAIVIYRQEVWPFSSKEIELVSSFASQAVIAIENCPPA